MTELDKVLRDNGIKPAKNESQKAFDEMMGKDMLKDFFHDLGDIFDDYTKRNNIPKKGWHKDSDDGEV